MSVILARLKNAFAKSRFANPESAARHVSLIAGGTIIAQAVGILTIPIVSRIYSPADYGIMAVYASVIAILGELSGLRYYWAIPLPKDERYAKALVVLSLGLQIVFVALLALVLFFVGEFLLTKLSMPELIPYRALIPLGLLATCSYIVLTYWAIREKLFSTIARTKITQSLSGVVAKIGLGLLGIRPLGLLIGTIIAQGGGITTLLRSLLKKKGVPRPEMRDIRRAALRYRKFPMYDTLSGVLITTGERIVSLVFVALYSTRIVGLFAMAQQLLGLPSAFVGKSIGQVFIQRGSAAKQNGNLDSVFVHTYRVLMRIGIFPILLVSFLAPQIFSWLLGEQWIQAGVFARIISPWIAIQFIYSPLSNVFPIMERQKMGLFFEFLHMPLRIFALFLGARFGNEITSLMFFTIANCIVYLIKLSYLNIISGGKMRVICKYFFIEMLSAILLLSLPILALNIGTIFFFFALLISIGLYGCMLLHLFKI